MEKPTLGLRPKWIVDELREQEIGEAIERYKEAGEEIPQEWNKEYKNLSQKNASLREIDRLSKFLLKNYPNEIGSGNPKEGESAVGVAIRLLAVSPEIPPAQDSRGTN